MTQLDRLARLIMSVPAIRPMCLGRSQGKRYMTAEHIAGHLLASGVILPPCKVGDFVYFVLEDAIAPGGWFISKERVTEIGSRGFFVSGYVGEEDDISVFRPWDELGKSVFLTQKDAERAKLRMQKSEE